MQCACAILLSGLPGCTVFFLVNGTILEKVIIERKLSVLIFSTIFDTFLILRRTEGDTTINVFWSSCKVPIILVILYNKTWMCFGLHVKYPVFLSYFIIKLEFSRQIFEKYSDIKLHDNTSSGSRVVPCGRAAGQPYVTKVISRFSQFCDQAYLRTPSSL